jgi:hypothetical protein
MSGARVEGLGKGVNENGAAGAERGEVSWHEKAPRTGWRRRCRGWGGVAGKGEYLCGGKAYSSHVNCLIIFSLLSASRSISFLY